jgi:dUTP pyrophosphatase
LKKNKNMSYNIEEMQEKLFLAMDPNTEYSLEDFDKEFSNVSHTAYVENSEMFKFPVKFINKSNNPDPEYATEGSAGFDFRANLGDDKITLLGGGKAIIPTGLYFELPTNLELQVRPRSGLAAKHSVTVLNSPGTVDSDYRGEVKVILINHGTESFVIEHGERIAQGVIANVTAKQMVKFIKTDQLSETDRGEGGFGSTGVK